MVLSKAPGLSMFHACDELEKMITSTKWYEFFWRRRLRVTLETMRYIGAIRGFEQGLRELENAGILKPIKPKKR